MEELRREGSSTVTRALFNEGHYRRQKQVISRDTTSGGSTSQGVLRQHWGFIVCCSENAACNAARLFCRWFRQMGCGGLRLWSANVVSAPEGRTIV